MRSACLAALVLLLGCLPGCAARGGALAPPVIHYGDVACEQCTMIVDDPRFAAACVDADGRTVHVFDDIGCMLEWQKAHHEKNAAAWVHDFDTRAWISADTARYVVETRVATPMGHGVVAVADSSRARAVAVRQGGRVVSLAEARTRLRRPQRFSALRLEKRTPSLDTPERRLP